MSVKALDLFQAYQTNQLPKESGYIVTSMFAETSTYSRYEIISYGGVKEIYLTEEGLTFQSDGKKIYILVEPPTYPNKHLDPIHRSTDESIPHRYNELIKFVCKNDAKLYVSKEPVMTYTSFTVLRPTGNNFALVFYDLPDVFETIDSFFQKTLNREAGVPQVDAKKAAQVISAELPMLRFTF
jgi:hypothetical protein